MSGGQSYLCALVRRVVAMIIASYCVIIWPGLSCADLKWSIYQGNVKVADDTVHARYEFTNTGDKPITILKVETVGGCVLTVPEKKTYTPGESGTIHAFLWIGDRTGNLSRQIEIITDNPKRPHDTVFFDVEIPCLLTLSTKTIRWSNAEDRTSRTVTLTPCQPKRTDPDPTRSPARIVRVEAVPAVVDLQLDPAPIALPLLPGVAADHPATEQPPSMTAPATAESHQAIASATQPSDTVEPDRAMPDKYVLTVTPKPEWTNQPFVVINVYTDTPAEKPRILRIVAQRNDLVN